MSLREAIVVKFIEQFFEFLCLRRAGRSFLVGGLLLEEKLIGFDSRVGTEDLKFRKNACLTIRSVEIHQNRFRFVCRFPFKSLRFS
jgi:hypothetical protein